MNEYYVLLCITYTQRMQWTHNREVKSVCLSCHLPHHLISYYDLVLRVHTNTRQITPLNGVLVQNQAVAANWLNAQPKNFVTMFTKAATNQTNSMLSLIYYHLFKIQCNIICLSTRSCNTTEGMLTGIQVRRPRHFVRFLTKTWIISPPKCPFRFWSHTASCSLMDNWSLSPRLKGNHWHPSVAKIKNEWNCASTPALAFMVRCLIAHTDTCTSKTIYLQL
jgi:hypothetical protein